MLPYRSSTKLYSLAEKKMVSIKKETPPPAWAQGQVIHDLGCNRGWMASFNQDNQQAFLSNPITGRHIKLPKLGWPFPSNIILTSSSPDAHDFRAIVTYNCKSSRIELCFPSHNRSTWLPVCNPVYYRVIAYSARQKRLFCLTSNSVECWDLESPSFLWEHPLYSEGDFKFDDSYFGRLSNHHNYLVMDEHSDRLFLVERDIYRRVGPDGSHMKYAMTGCMDYPCKTFNFKVYEIDANKGTLTKMEGSLDGLAMFVRTSNSFALPAADFNLTPDSIYFCDDYVTLRGGNDIGIFNYVDTKISSIYYPSHPSHRGRRLAKTFWFTPNPH
ncbi:hypothetical protein SASPL_115169 [Salvia splendens]|uniref:KIB1-4 beta-propeller domain-containing protein n=1 Tax=Salvia splendens TaxID=180675 RepID=A0A8X8Y518_SALSN|nr:hypothetical protein SASPL_115169 [Salvia splendens]